MSKIKDYYHEQMKSEYRNSVKEIPILFSTPMVQAELENRKTNTRRTRGLEKINQYPGAWYLQTLFLHATGRFTFAPAGNYNPGKEDIIEVKCPFGQKGDLLWVRETWRKSDFPDSDGIYEFKASMQNPDAEWNKRIWKPSIHMPKAAARIWLQVEEIRVERLQDISEEDISNEGILIPVTQKNTPFFVLGQPNSAFSFLPEGCLADGAPPLTKKQVIFAFWAELWCKINGRASWDLNPWVWVVKFKVLSTAGKPEKVGTAD